MSSNIVAGAIGVALQVLVQEANVAVNIAAAANMLVYLRDPSGVTTSHTGALVTTGTDGKLQYITIAGDLATPGTWSIQAYLEIGSWHGRTVAQTFDVSPAL